MDLIKIQNDKYEIYEDLIMRRDNLRKEADNYLAQYIHHFGDLITESFKAQIACISRKKAISYCQMIVNRGEIVDIKELDNYLKECMKEYNEQLKSMVEDVENCRELKVSTEAAVQKSKALYRTIAKQIHPDINPEAAKNESLMELWQRASAAHRCNDWKELEVIEVLVKKALEGANIGTVVIDIPDIENRIAELKAEIEKIRSTDPYQFKYLFEDKNAMAEKKKALEEEIEEYKNYEKELAAVLREFVKFGVTFPWEENLQ